MMGMTTTGEEEEEEEEGLKGTGRDKSEGDENELEEEKLGRQPRLIRRMSQVPISPLSLTLHFSFKPVSFSSYSCSSSLLF